MNARNPYPEQEHVTKAEAILLARDAADAAIEIFGRNMAIMLKPVMYEVAENVTAAQEKSFIELFSKVIGTDVRDSDKVREFNKDIFYIRDKRMEHERAARLAKETVLISIAKWTGVLLILGILASLGLYHPGEATSTTIQR